MNPKITKQKFLTFLDKYTKKNTFRTKATSCPVARYLQSCKYTNVNVDSYRIYYRNQLGEEVHIPTPKWIEEFIFTYDYAKPKHRLAAAKRVIQSKAV